MTKGPADIEPILKDYTQALSDCRDLYVHSARLCAQHHAHALNHPANEFVELMDDLHRGLAVKIYTTVALVDHKWTQGERRLAQMLFEHAWLQRLDANELRETMQRLSGEVDTISWYSLVRPFVEVAPLRERIADLESIAMRMALIIAKVDGDFSSSEKSIIKSVRNELRRHLQPIQIDAPTASSPIDPAPGRPARPSSASQAATIVETIESDATAVKTAYQLTDQHPGLKPIDDETRLAELMQQLDSLIGLESVKKEVRTLANFLKLQQHRRDQNLPETNVSLHMIFQGNPGTGKTTVARLVAQIFQAMGVLKQGHLIETDRSGLVAEYAGQTGPKTNERIDEALDGVLFIDEAYSLVAGESDDAFGREALQTLLKRMEDDRDRLVVVLAGYPQPMADLIRTNPGLSSRLNRKLTFEDYAPIELCQIFERFCETNHYEIPSDVRGRMLLGTQRLFEHRDEHFGNGRLMRNVFEDAIRHLANRVSEQSTITHELLTRFAPADLELPGTTSTDLDALIEKVHFSVHCPGCEKPSRARYTTLGRKVRCGKCQHQFCASWGAPVSPSS